MSSRCPLNNHDPGKTYNAKALSTVIKKKINEIDRTHGKENKKKGVIVLFNLIVKYQDFVHDYPKFKAVIKEKLINYAKYDDFVLNDHYQSLFGEPIPL